MEDNSSQVVVREVRPRIWSARVLSNQNGRHTWPCSLWFTEQGRRTLARTRDLSITRTSTDAHRISCEDVNWTKSVVNQRAWHVLLKRAMDRVQWWRGYTRISIANPDSWIWLQFIYLHATTLSCADKNKSQNRNKCCLRREQVDTLKILIRIALMICTFHISCSTLCLSLMVSSRLHVSMERKVQSMCLVILVNFAISTCPVIKKVPYTFFLNHFLNCNS